MKIVIIGSGNVAYHFAKAFLQNGIAVAQLFGRNTTELEKISQELNIPYSTKKIEIADLYFICVNDASIQEISTIIPTENCLVAHTSGAISINNLIGNYRKAVVYPLQTFSKTKKLVYSEIPFFIDTEEDKDRETLVNLLQKISRKIGFAKDITRKHIHLTAVFACNFTNHLFARAKEIADKHAIPFDYFLPLIDETVQKIHHLEPKLAQTGPAIRNDNSVLEEHRKLLKDSEQLLIYDTLNQSIKKMYEL
ncbi:MAG: DUF2520 domain-containing protein [Bacteroidetes bacterium]|nr:DUF2520 domain-containing protein [Bacteroidota bacterium]